MQKDYTHIAVILDRTGSMNEIRDATIKGFNEFLAEQKAGPGSATLTLVQFDTDDPYEVVHRFRAIKNVPDLTRETYVPRASTPLLDAMGRGITDLERSIAEIEEAGRPEKVMMVIITDGRENASREYTKDRIRRMIEEKRKLGWEFLFLSSEFEAIDEAGEIGIVRANTVLFQKTGAGTRDMWKTASSRVISSRKRKLDSFSDNSNQV